MRRCGYLTRSLLINLRRHGGSNRPARWAGHLQHTRRSPRPLRQCTQRDAQGSKRDAAVATQDQESMLIYTHRHDSALWEGPEEIIERIGAGRETRASRTGSKSKLSRRRNTEEAEEREHALVLTSHAQCVGYRQARTGIDRVPGTPVHEKEHASSPPRSHLSRVVASDSHPLP